MKFTINQFIDFLPKTAEDDLSVKANLCAAKLSEAAATKRSLIEFDSLRETPQPHEVGKLCPQHIRSSLFATTTE